jgi:integrase
VVTIAGRDHYLGPHGTKASLAEYDRLIGEWIAAGRPTTSATVAGFTINQVCDRYRKHAEATYPPGGHLDAIRVSVRTLRTRYGETLANDFGPLALKAVRQQFIEAGVSRGHVNRLTNNLKRMFKWAASEELCFPSVHVGLSTVDGLRYGRTEARETDPVLPVDDATVERTLPHVNDVVVGMIRLQRLTGMRPDEVCKLRPCEIDRTGDVWRYTPAHHKTKYLGRQRVVFIGPQGQDILLPYLLRDSEAFCFSPTEAEAKRRAEQNAARKTPLSCGNTVGTNRVRKPRCKPGARYTPNTYRRAIHRACDYAFPAPDPLGQRDDETVGHWQSRLTTEQKADLAAWQSRHRWSPNQLRHTAATEIRKQFGLEAAQVALGHSQANVTQIYAERDMEKAAEIMRRIG